MRYKVRFENSEKCEWKKLEVPHRPKENEDHVEKKEFFQCVPKDGSKCKEQNEVCKAGLTEGTEWKTYKCFCQGKETAGSGGDYVYLFNESGGLLDEGKECKWKEVKKGNTEWDWECEGKDCTDDHSCHAHFGQNFDIWVEEGGTWVRKTVQIHRCRCELDKNKK